ncbi:hypothetical protein D9758_008640 [Tetrapyrgos nigripes]|uniref:Tautomerase cis-CaaD-like domain-containing protein n=1 Tax=Tetrapyrgos nigripes TaxID=182062 RepID=A0A8H5D4Z1_9AGAR|nr:hypothetical protein D9758_008640 [Tetrapyrgos nigripes]
MPLHRLYVPPNLYTPEEKSAIAEAITEVYTGMPNPLPPFYVVVIFEDIPKQNYFVGGKPTDRFLRIVVHHLARQFADDAKKREFLGRYEAAIEPWTKGKGIDWEVQVSDQDPAGWNENGLAPPLPGTEGEKMWLKLNKAVPYEAHTSGHQANGNL